MMKYIVSFWFILVLIGGQLGPLLGGQEDYRLGAEDEIQIKVWGHDDLTRTTRVGLNGTITFPFAGEIKAQGLSVQNLQKELERRLGPKYIVDPRVSITVTEFKSLKFFVVGNVQKPGAYPLTKPIRVVEALSLAGGVSAGTTGKPMSGTMAIIIRAQPGITPDQPRMPDGTPESQKVKVSLSSAMAGDATQNVEIKNGDTVYIPNLVYYVTGEVQKSGRFPYEDNMTVLEAITTAQGFTDKASRRGVYIIREHSGVKNKVKVRLDDIIQPGDNIVVPESWF